MSNARHVPRVGYDTLLDVVDVLVNEDSDEARNALMALSQTCKYLRLEGSRRLLSRPVRVNLIMQPHLVAAFCRFILGDPVVRLPLLRSLSINVHHLKDDTARLLADVLAQSYRLEDLDLQSLFQVTKPVIVIICSAFSSLASLKHLTVGYCARHDDPSYCQVFYDAFQTIRSSLTSVQVYIPPTILPNPYILYVRNGDPIFLLSKLTGSLRRVGFEGTLIRVGGGIRVYPFVEELEIAGYLDGMPDLKTYLLSFPSLQHLQCGNKHTIWYRHRHEADIYQVECADATIQQWHDYNKRDSARQDHAWTMLRSFRGSIIDAYVLSLPCRRLRLHLMSTGGRRSAEYAMLSTILSDVRPSSLRFSLKVYDGRGYIPILPPNALSGWAADLGTLEIRINIVKHTFDLDKCFSNILEMIHSMSLTSFQFELRCANMRTQFGETLEDPRESEDGYKCRHPLDDGTCYTQTALLQEDLHQRVRDILSVAPALRRVTLMWARCYRNVPARVIGIDVDNMPHSTDRPGDLSDGWEKADIDW